MNTPLLGNILMVLSIVPLAFLCHTLLNIERLGITITHLRIIVEFIIFLMLMGLGLYIHLKPS